MFWACLSPLNQSFTLTFVKHLRLFEPTGIANEVYRLPTESSCQKTKSSCLKPACSPSETCAVCLRINQIRAAPFRSVTGVSKVPFRSGRYLTCPQANCFRRLPASCVSP